MDGQDVATTKINDESADVDMNEMGKKQENDNLNNEEKETALDFVNNAIDGIIKKLKLHKLSSMGNQTVKTNQKNKNDKMNVNDEIEDWQSNEETYETVICDNTVLLRKLLQLADDINTGNDNKFTKERKISILQNIGFAISRMDSKINECDGFMEMNEIFLQPIDNSGEMKSKLKNRAEMMDEKSVKDLIRTMHQKTKMEGLMTDETQISMVAYMISVREMRHSINQIFKCIKVYIIVCQSLQLDEQMESRKVKDFVLSEEFESECDEIFEVAKEYLDLPKIDKESDDSDDDDNSNTGNDNPKADNNKCKKLKKKKVVKTCDAVRFDKENSMNKRVYYSSKVLENVYNGVLKWDKIFEYGCDYYAIDCGNKLLSFCAGTGWKYREPAIGCYYLNKYNYFDAYPCNPGFADVSTHCYCDDIYNRCWYQGDSRIKGTYVIDDNGNKKKKNEKKNDENENDNDDDDDDDANGDSNNDNRGFEYILRGNGSITSTKDAIMSLSHQGTLQVWYYEKLMKQNRSYWSLLGDCDDDDLPAKDEFGIKLNRHLTQNIGFDDDGDATIEISTGQSPHLTKRIQLFNKNEKIHHSNLNNYDGIQMSRISGADNNNDNDKLVVSYANTLNLYDLNQECVDNVYLASRFSVKLPTRQHLYSKDNCTLISYDFNCVKIWDTRMGIIAHTSIYGCGKKRIATTLGFSINGHSFIATGGCDEAVTIWDLRKHNNNNNGALYEMSTGNNAVNELAWHESSLTLYATTECSYIDRLGYKYYGGAVADREDCDSDGNELDWPERAVHKKGDFKSNYDAGTNAICSYSFLSY